MPDPSLAQLASLLRTLFNADELRIFVASGEGASGLISALPGSMASLDVLAYAAAEGLHQRGLIGRDFFARLEAERPHQRDAIRKLRNQWLSSLNLEAGALWGDRYRLDAQIGDGGFGCVWRAVDEHTGQLVALKILHKYHLDNNRMRQRFYRGAQALAGLSHPAIVRVYSATLEIGLHSFYAMEYVRGETLDACVRQRRLPTDELLAIALQIGDALTHVHERGLLHRDIKPTNILITDRHTARLIDFDLVTGDDFVALTTEAVGTRLYMPPEADTSDPKTSAYDIYSLARTIEFILRGREPTVRELADVADIDAPPEVKAILRAALQREPQRRIAHMATFCAGLRSALGAAGPPPPQSTSPRSTPPRPPPDPPPEPITTAHAPTAQVPAVLSIAGHIAVNLFLAPPQGSALLVLLFFTAPSIRVLLDRERNKYLTGLHYVWVALWMLPAFLIPASLFATSSKTKVFPALVITAAIALGVYASILHLRRLQATSPAP